MAISDILEDAKVYLEQLKRKYKFKKANMHREEQVELQASLAKCRGKLEICKNDFNRTIRTQSRNIADGMRIGADTLIQERMLWDAAVGYMLVRDAIFALQSINSFDSVSHAYDMLDAAVKQMSGKKSKFPGFGASKERNAYGYITSSTAVKEKETLLESFFDRLKATGDIEECLGMAQSNSNGSGEDTMSEIDEMMRQIKSGSRGGSSAGREEPTIDINDLRDIQPPKGSV
jgi:hypothetical protein